MCFIIFQVGKYSQDLIFHTIFKHYFDVTSESINDVYSEIIFMIYTLKPFLIFFFSNLHVTTESTKTDHVQQVTMKTNTNACDYML